MPQENRKLEVVLWYAIYGINKYYLLLVVVQARTVDVPVPGLDGGGDQVADDAGAGLVGAEPHRGDAGAGVEREIGGHLLPRFPLRRREPETDGEG